MFKLLKIALGAASLSLVACSQMFAGGVDEETNTVTAAANVEISSSAAYTPVEEPTTICPDSSYTTADGTIVCTSKKSESVTIISQPCGVTDTVELISSSSSATSSSDTVISIIDAGTSPQTGFFTSSKTFKGSILNGHEPLNLSIDIDGHMENFQTDEYGQFTIENLPLGTHPVYVTTVNGNPTNVAFLFDNRGAQSILGPVPASVAAAVSGEDLSKNHDQTFFPESSNSTPSSSSRSETTSFDPTTSFGNGGISYHNHESHPMNSLPNDVDYGHICTYEAHGITGPQTKECNFTENPEAISIEIIAEFENLDTENSYRKNIVGKLWNTYSGIFSLAIINNECGVTSPSLAFFASNGAGFTCENAVISSAVIETGKQHFITALWIDNALEIFMDGFMIAFRVVQNTPSTILDAPIFLGDDNLTFILDEVQLGNKAITSADVLYRYYHKGGER